MNGEWSFEKSNAYISPPRGHLLWHLAEAIYGDEGEFEDTALRMVYADALEDHGYPAAEHQRKMADIIKRNQKQ